MKPSPSHNIITNISTDKELVANFMEYMQLITKQTGVELIIDTEHKGIARMQQGNNKIFFNPVFTLQQLQIIADQRAKELGVENTFQFTISHLSQIILHEINHIINHTELTLSNKTIEIDGKELNMLEYQQYLYDTFGPSFKEFENIFEDIDVNNHATKLQAPVFDIPKKEIYQHLCAPNSNFSKSPLHEQFTWTCLRESMINEEPCSIDEKVRKDINRIKESGGLLETIRNPKLSYDEQLIAIHDLYENYYLPLKKEEDKKEDPPPSGKKGGDSDNQDNKGNKPNNNTKPILLPHLLDNLNNPQSIPQQLNEALNTKPDTHQDTGAKKEQKPIIEAMKQAIENKILEDRKTPEDRDLEHMIAKQRGIDPKTEKDKCNKIKQDIKQQNELQRIIKTLTDDKGNKVYDMIIQEIFSKIIQIRKRQQIYEKSPRLFSEGGQFDAQSFTSGIISLKSGNHDPLLMKQISKKEKEQKKAGAFNITFILDGSGSMSSPEQKNIDQKLSTLLMLYALQQLNEQLSEGDLGLKEIFLIETQALMFQGSKQVEIIKERNTKLGLKEMIEVSEKLDYKNGGDTNAYDAIQQYYEQISHPLPKQTKEEYEEWLEKVKEGKIKEILFVLSDGGFNGGDDSKAKILIKKLREMGIIVCGIGITVEGSLMVSIFGNKSTDNEKNKGGFGLVCKQTKDLGQTLNTLLLEHLADPSIIGG